MTWAPVIGSLIVRPERPPVVGTERALLDAVIADPDDDGPRLVYADWLQHRGGADSARGELIAVQCALARIADPDEHNRLKARDFELVEQHGNRWCAEVGIGDVRNNWYRSEWAADFHRGFVETVELPTSAYGAVVTRLFALEPVRALVLVGRRADGAWRIPESPHLQRLRSLGIRGTYLADDALAALVASPMLTDLTELVIEQQTIGPITVGALLRAPYTSARLSINVGRLTASECAQLVDRFGANFVLRE